MANDLSAFDGEFLRSLNISIDGVEFPSKQREERQQPPSKRLIEEVRKSQLTAEEREQERRELRRSLECGIERDSPVNSIHVPKDHHIFDLSIINVKAKRWRHYTDIIARTKDEALLEAIRRFDQTWPQEESLSQWRARRTRFGTS